MALTQLVINLRYALMSLSLSQKLSPSFRTPQRLLASFGITDEIFAVSHSKPGLLTPVYMYGLILISFLGWTGGTILGAVAGNILPAMLTDAMGIMLYGMFLALIIHPAREDRGILTVIGAAAAVSQLLRYVITGVSQGFAVIISAVAAAVLGALLHPLKEEGL